MLGYNKINASEGNDTNINDRSCERIICHYWYFLKINSRFQPKFCDDYNDMSQKTISCTTNNFCFMTKSEAVDKKSTLI